MTVQVFGPEATISYLHRAFSDTSPSNAVFNTQVSGVKGMGDMAFANTFATNWVSLSHAALAKQVLNNMGLASAPLLQDALTDCFSAYSSKTVDSNGRVIGDTRGAIALQFALVFANSENSEYSAIAKAWNDEIAASYRYSSTASTTSTSSTTTTSTTSTTSTSISTNTGTTATSSTTTSPIYTPIATDSTLVVSPIDSVSTTPTTTTSTTSTTTATQPITSVVTNTVSNTTTTNTTTITSTTTTSTVGTLSTTVVSPTLAIRSTHVVTTDHTTAPDSDTVMLYDYSASNPLNSFSDSLPALLVIGVPSDFTTTLTLT